MEKKENGREVIEKDMNVCSSFWPDSAAYNTIQYNTKICNAHNVRQLAELKWRMFLPCSFKPRHDIGKRYPRIRLSVRCSVACNMFYVLL